MTDVIKIGADYTVIGIQNNPVSSTPLTDGYVLTWNGTSGNWEPKPIPSQSSGLRKDYFTSNGNWTCPAGVTTVQLIMCGGGGGAASGGVGGTVSTGSANGGGSGGGAVQQYFVVSVTPGNVYPVTIGAGGAGGASRVGTGINMSGNDGQDGYSTTFSTLAIAIGGGGSLPNSQPGPNWAGSYVNETQFPSSFKMPGWGCQGANNGPRKGHQSYTGFSGGTQGSDGSFQRGGGSGGGGGSAGVGGNGGNGSSSGDGSNGQDGGANTGAGGGGGGACPNTFTSGAGGNGGSGYLYVIY